MTSEKITESKEHIFRQGMKLSRLSFQETENFNINTPSSFVSSSHFSFMLLLSQERKQDLLEKLLPEKCMQEKKM
jgi:hypothetical protein